MTPLKDISGLNRPLQGIEGEEKARRVRSAKALQTTESKNVKETQALFDRKDKDNNLKPYYEYRDSAMSILSPFKYSIKCALIILDTFTGFRDLSFIYKSFPF